MYIKNFGELFLWKVLIDKITGVSNLFLDMTTLAVSVLFFGEESFAITIFEITLGQSRDDVDFDLTKLRELVEVRHEEDSFKMNLKTLSRKQLRIAIHIDVHNDFAFFLYNDGRLPMYVDGKVLLTRTKTQLVH